MATPRTSAAVPKRRPKPAARKLAGKAASAPAAPIAESRPPSAISQPSSAQDVPTSVAADGKAKHKLVRDSFTIPKNEYAVLAELKQRSLGLGRPVKKSELLRAGIAALHAMPDPALLTALQAVPSLKTGRPKDGRKR